MSDRFVGDVEPGMSEEACEIAMSEISGISRESMCGWVLVAMAHDQAAPDGHEMRIMVTGGDYPWAAEILTRAALNAAQIAAQS
jgi:hypothetical protein